MSIEAMKQALEALKEYGFHLPYCTQHPTYACPENYPPCGCGFDMATETLRQAIEQAEKQEPVGFVHPEDLQSVTLGHNSYAAIYVETEGHTGGIPLYTAPPQREWIGLTDEEKQNILDKNTHPYGRFDSYTSTLGIVNDTESKLKEKNYG